MTTRNHEPENLQAQFDSCALICRMCERLGSDLEERAQLGDEAGWGSNSRPDLSKVRDLVSDAVAFRATLASLHSGVRRLIDALTPGDIEISLPWFWCSGPLIPGPVGPLLVGRLVSCLESDPPLERLLELKVHIARWPGDAWDSIEQACAEALKRAAFTMIGETPPHSPQPSRQERDDSHRRSNEAFEWANRSMRQLSGNGTHTLSINVAVAEELSQSFGNAVKGAISMVRAKAVGPDEQRHLEAVSRSSATVIEWTHRLDDLLRRVAERIVTRPVSSDWVRVCSAFHGHEAGSQLHGRLWEWMHSDERTSKDLDVVQDSILDLYRDARKGQERYWAAWTLMTVRTGTFRFHATDFFELRSLSEMLPDDCQEEVNEAIASGALRALLGETEGIPSELGALTDDEAFPLHFAFADVAEFVSDALGGEEEFLRKLFDRAGGSGGERLVDPILEWLEDFGEFVEFARLHKGKVLADALIEAWTDQQEDAEEDNADDASTAIPATAPPVKAQKPKKPVSAPRPTTSNAAPTRQGRRRE